MLGVVAIACIPVMGGVRFEGLDLPLLGTLRFGDVGEILITILWIAFLANLVNLIDGLDALAAGIVSIAAVSFAILAASFDRADAAALAAMICGATLAFLRHNYHPARIIMGDTGSLALGFVLACVAVQGVLKTAATVALVMPLLVLAVPILDTSFVVAKRLKYGRKPWAADHNHFYHRFMRIGYSQRRTAAYLHLWAALLSAWAILVRFVPPRPGGEWDLRNSLIVGARRDRRARDVRVDGLHARDPQGAPPACARARAFRVTKRTCPSRRSRSWRGGASRERAVVSARVAAPSGVALAVFVAVVVNVGWGSTPVVTRLAVEDFEPLMVAVLRTALAGLIALPILLASHQALPVAQRGFAGCSSSRR